MTYDKRDYPEWSWSLSRFKTFDECKLKYFFTYYLSYNGWSADSDILSKKAYKYKKLTSLSLTFGNAFHEEAKGLVNTIMSKQVLLPNPQDITEKVRYALNNAYIASKKSRACWEINPKKFPMLYEIYYKDSLLKDKVNDIKANIDLCAKNLLQSFTITNLIRNSKSILLQEVDEQLQSINFEGVKVYVKLDLLYRDGDNKWVITDWKTGKDALQNPNQLALYALYVNMKYGISLNDMDFCIESLLDGKSFQRNILTRDVDNIKTLIMNSVDQMKSYLYDPEKNIPLDMTKYERTSKIHICKNCNFRELCNMINTSNLI